MRKWWALSLAIFFALALLANLIWLPQNLPFFSPLEQVLRKVERSKDQKERLRGLMNLVNFVKESSITPEQKERATQKLLWLADKDLDEGVRSLALKLLWLLGEKGNEMQHVLVKALCRSPQEAIIAVEIIPQIANETLWLKLIDAFESEKDPTFKDRLKRVLWQMPTSVWKDFCKRLARNPKIWHPVFEGLKPPPFSFRSNLVQWALSEDIELGKGALMLLSKFPPSPAESERLKPLANSQDSTIKALVFSVWANSPSKALISELRKGLSGSTEIAYFASSALLKLGALRLEEGRKLLSHSYPPLRAQGALALAPSRLINDWKALIRALKDPDPEVVRNATIALVAKGSNGLSVVLSVYKNEKAPEKRAAMLMGMAGFSHPKVFTSLVKALRFGDWRERSAALAGISFHGDKLLSTIDKLVHSPNKQDRLAVIDAMNAIKTEKALKLLMKIAKSDPDDQVRCEAALSLSNYGVKEAMPILADLVQRGNLSIANAAAMGLTRYGEEGRKLLREIIKSERRETILAAARALVTFNDQMALDILRKQASKEDFSQRIMTLQLLARGGDKRALRELIGFLSHNEPLVRLRTRLALYAVGKQAVPTLIQSLDSHDFRLRAEAALILGALKATEAREKLAALLKDENHQVRQAAQLALSQMESRN